MCTPQNEWIQALQNWAVENPIKNIEKIRTGYKNYDGYIGLPSQQDELMSVSKLILPLGDEYREKIPKELGELKTLTELSIFARNSQEIPSEIFHLPNLKKIYVSSDYKFKIKDDDLKALIANGCQDIHVNSTYMRTNEDTIRDDKIIDCLSKTDLYITSKDFGIRQKELYNAAKKIALEDEEMSRYMMKFLDSKYIYGFDAFLAANKYKDIDKVDALIYSILLDYQENEGYEAFSENILEVGLSIVEIFPYKALELYHRINAIAATQGFNSFGALDLSIEIVYSVAKYDTAKALELLDIIDVDEYKFEVLEKIQELISESKKDKAKNFLGLFEDRQLKCKLQKISH